MASMGDIKHSIRSISETEQITRAMHLISTSKMKKAINKFDSNHVHFERVQSALKDILAHSHELSHPYIGESEHGRAAYVVIAADKGLCGGYNHNVLNSGVRVYAEKQGSPHSHSRAGSPCVFQPQGLYDRRRVPSCITESVAL